MVDVMKVISATGKHIAQMADWMKARGLEPYPVELFAGAHGYAIDEMAVCWMYPTYGPIALLENLCANPALHATERSIAIDLVVKEAISDMRRQGWRFIYSTTSLHTVVQRAKRFGFKVKDHGCFVLMADLGGP
jgi:hypothetical protein